MAATSGSSAASAAAVTVLVVSTRAASGRWRSSQPRPAHVFQLPAAREELVGDAQQALAAEGDVRFLEGVQGLGHHAFAGVLDRKQAVIGVAPAHRCHHVAQRRHRLVVGLGTEGFPRGQVGEGSLRPQIRDAQTRLQGAGSGYDLAEHRRDRVAREQAVVLCHERLDEVALATGPIDRAALAALDRADFLHLGSPSVQQDQDLSIDPIDLLPQLLERTRGLGIAAFGAPRGVRVAGTGLGHAASSLLTLPPNPPPPSRPRRNPTRTMPGATHRQGRSGGTRGNCCNPSKRLAHHIRRPQSGQTREARFLRASGELPASGPPERWLFPSILGSGRNFSAFTLPPGHQRGSPWAVSGGPCHASAVSRVMGLTGGIGTGKSTVARMFAVRGAIVIDADAIVHELQAPGEPMLAEIAREFGAEMIRPDGSLDRERLGKRVFADPEARTRLGQLVHPAVGREMLRRLEAARAANAPLILLDIPLLLEGRARAGGAKSASASDLVAEVIVVYAPEEAQVARQVARDGASEEHARERMAAQLPIAEKRRLADHVIDNSGSLEETERQVEALFAKLSGVAEAAP
jgi:dephospho-CoA kinase